VPSAPAAPGRRQHLVVRRPPSGGSGYPSSGSRPPGWRRGRPLAELIGPAICPDRRTGASAGQRCAPRPPGRPARGKMLATSISSASASARAWRSWGARAHSSAGSRAPDPRPARPPAPTSTSAGGEQAAQGIAVTGPPCLRAARPIRRARRERRRPIGTTSRGLACRPPIRASCARESRDAAAQLRPGHAPWRSRWGRRLTRLAARGAPCGLPAPPARRRKGKADALIEGELIIDRG